MAGTNLKIAKNLKYGARVTLGQTILGTFLLGKLPSVRRKMTFRSTDLVIEGFPRSANSYFLNIFSHWNPGLMVAHHLHTPYQIIRAAKFGLPCLCLIRRPQDALASLLIVDRNLSLDVAIWSYINFYTKIRKYRSSFILTDYESAISDPAEQIALLNKKFGTGFAHGTITSKLESEILERLTIHNRSVDQPELLAPVPSKEKNQLKELIVGDICAHPNYQNALELYKSFASV